MVSCSMMFNIRLCDAVTGDNRNVMLCGDCSINISFFIGFKLCFISYIAENLGFYGAKHWEK